MKTEMLVACLVAGGISVFLAMSFPVVRKLCRLLDHTDDVVAGAGPRVQALIESVEQLVVRVDALVDQTQPRIESTIDAVDHTVDEITHLVHDADEIVEEMNVVADVEAEAGKALGVLRGMAHGVHDLFVRHPKNVTPVPVPEELQA